MEWGPTWRWFKVGFFFLQREAWQPYELQINFLEKIQAGRLRTDTLSHQNGFQQSLVSFDKEMRNQPIDSYIDTYIYILYIYTLILVPGSDLKSIYLITQQLEHFKGNFPIIESTGRVFLSDGGLRSKPCQSVLRPLREAGCSGGNCVYAAWMVGLIGGFLSFVVDWWVSSLRCWYTFFLNGPYEKNMVWKWQV